MSFWGATVITSLASAIPVVGDNLVTWLWGGLSVDLATLNRFLLWAYRQLVLLFVLDGGDLVLLVPNYLVTDCLAEDKFSGAGLATIGLSGAGIGIGNVFGSLITPIMLFQGVVFRLVLKLSDYGYLVLWDGLCGKHKV